MTANQPTFGDWVYLDTNIIIYIFDGQPRYRHAIEQCRDAFTRSKSGLVGCQLLLTELLVGPIKAGQSGLVQAYREFLEGEQGFTLLPVKADTFRLAAEIRAQFNLKTADAIHLAAAQIFGCNSFLTNDKRLAQAAGPMGVYFSDFLEQA